MKNLCVLALLMLLSLSPTMAWSEEKKVPSEDLADLVATAVANNPELKSSQSRWQMFVSKSRQTGALDDPMFMFKLQNMVARNPTSFDKDPQTAKVIGISQQLPFWGKRALKQEVAQHEAESYKWAIEERKLELIRMVKETYYQLYAVDKSLEIVEKNLRILTDFVTIAESKYSVGQGVQQDIYKAGLEKSKMLDMQITLRQQSKSLEANLNYLLYRPDATSIGRIADFELPKQSLSAQQLKETAYEKRPQIKSLTSLTNKGQASRRLAQKEFYPDFNLFFEYMFREESMNDPGYNMFTVGFTFNLPLQRERRHAMVAEASSETTMSQEELNALKNSISFSINDLLAQMERRRQLVELYQGGIIPQAEQSLESAVISYKVNKVDFLTLLDGRVNLFNYERELYESQAEYMMRLAQLEAVIGTDLGSLPAAQMALPPTTQAEQSLPPAAVPPTSDHSQHK
jgi:outer membrane protein TolC